MSMGFNASDEIDYKIPMFLVLLRNSTCIRLCYFSIPFSFRLQYIRGGGGEFQIFFDLLV
jgi:hypothetical protein